MIPSVRIAVRLARALGCRVEDLFAEDESPCLLTAAIEAGSMNPGQRVATFYVAGRWVAHPIPERPSTFAIAADALVTSHNPEGTAVLSLLASEQRTAENLLLVGCAPALGILADRTSRSAKTRATWLPFASVPALRALAERRAHVAGVHLTNDEGQADETLVRSLLGVPTRIFTLASWQEGFVVVRGNPRAIRAADDLLRADVRIVAREKGAAAQLVLERLIRRLGASPHQVLRNSALGSSHDDVATRVALGLADVGIATESVALAYGLEFVPLLEERFDLVVTEDLLADSRLARLLEALQSGAFRRELAALRGYDTRLTGNAVN